MGFPAVKKRSMDVPTGPTGHLSSSKPTPKAGGSASTGTSGKPGLVNSQMKTPLGRKVGRR